LKRLLMAALAVPLLGLGACGQTTGDRTLSGAGIGAGVGLLGGALAGSPLTGALLGGALGAGAGLLTSAGLVDLGRPAWR
jgi:osmotically inducible lipoprotein OsmB